MAFTTKYQPINDGGVPRSLTGTAREVISGGQLVFCSGADNKVNISGVNSLADGDIEFAVSASGALFTGIAMANAASGAILSVATRGTFVLGCEGTVDAGYVVATLGADGVLNNAGSGLQSIGRAVTAAGSEGYAVVQIGL